MKVVMVGPGLTAYSMSLCSALADAGLEVTLLTDDWHEDLDGNVGTYYRQEVFAYPTRWIKGRWVRGTVVGRILNGFSFLFALARVIKICRMIKPDVVHVQGLIRSEPFAILCLLSLRGGGFRIIHTPHNVGARAKFPGASACWRAMLGLSHDIIVHSRSAKEAMEAFYGVGRHKVDVIPLANWAIAVEQSGQLDKHTARSHLQIDPSSKVLLFFGHITPRKGLEGLLRALPDLGSRLPGLVLIIAGRAPEGFGIYEDLIRDLGIAGLIKAHPKWVPLEALPIYFGACDAVVLPYRKLMEVDQSAVIQLAYAFGRPVVATAVGGIAEEVLHGETGLLVPPDDRFALANACELLLRSPLETSRMGERARVRSSELSWKHVADETIRVYLRVAGGASEGAEHAAKKRGRT